MKVFGAISLATFALCVSAIDGHYHGPPAPLNHDGTVAETPEVKHLKAERLAALYEAFAKAPKGDEESYKHDYEDNQSYNNHIGHEHKHQIHYEKHEPQYRYHGPPAPLNHDGTVAETEEVKHIKAERLAALAEGFAKAKDNFYYHDRSKRSYDLIKSGHYHGPPAPLNHDGTVAETPEVKHLKAERLAALHEAFAKAPKGHEESYNHENYEDNQSYNHISHEHKQQIHYEKHEPQYRYHGPPAPLNHDGTVAETEEVKHIKAERLAALAEGFAKAKENFYYHDRSKRSYDLIKSGHYHGPPAPLNHDGTVAETPEVKHLKAEHLAAVYEAFAKAPKGHEESYEHEENQSYNNHISHEHKHKIHYEKHEPQYRYHGPPAPLNHDGTVAETEEVKHIKAERLAALAEGFAKAKKDFYYHDRSKRSYDLIKSGHYHGPPAPLNHDGTVAETPEVKHRKAEHLAALHEAFAKAPKGHESHKHEIYEHKNEVHYEKHEPKYRYHGPPAPLNHDGTVAETPEVKHVKAERLAALHEAFAKAPIGHEENYDNHEIYEHKNEEHKPHYVYHGPPAPLNHDGTVAETPEVHARKIEHLQAHHKAHLG